MAKKRKRSKNWGGGRSNSGRKPLPPKEKKIGKTICLDTPMWNWIDKQEGSRSQVIADLVAVKIKRSKK